MPVVGIQTLRGHVAPPLLAGRLPDGPREIALSGGELRALHRSVGGLVSARTTRGVVPLRITGQVVLSPEITNEQVKLGSGGVMTLAGAGLLSRTPLPVNVYLVRLRHPGDAAAIARLKQEFPGVVLPAVPPPEVREVKGVNGLPLVLAFVLTLLAVGTIAQTLVTSVRRRRRDLAILKAVGFVGRIGRAHVACSHRHRRDGPAGRPAARRGRRALGVDPAGPGVRDPAGGRALPGAAAGRPGGPPAGQRGRGYPRADRGAHPGRRGAQDRVVSRTDPEDPGTRNFIRPLSAGPCLFSRCRAGSGASNGGGGWHGKRFQARERAPAG